MKKNCFKCVSLLLVVVLSTVLITGCGEKKPEQSKNETGSIYNYYVFQQAYTYLYKNDPSYTSNTDGYDWNQNTENGVLSDVIKKEAFDVMIGKQTIVDYAEAHGFSLPQSDSDSIQTSINQAKQQMGDEEFNLNLKALGFDSEQTYAELLRLEREYEAVKTDFQSNKSRYKEDGYTPASYKNDSMMSAKHILIKSDSEKTKDPKGLAEEILAKIKKGEDFDKLMKEYNEDPGETEAGYTFGPGEMVSEFENATKALDINAVSDIVQTSYGYHIIKRVEGVGEFTKYLIEKNDIKYENSEFAKNYSVADIMNSINSARMKLSEIESKKGATKSNG